MYRKEKGHVLVLAKEINGEDVLVTRDEVQGYVADKEFLYFLSIYQYTKLWGMPNGNGWANEPTDVLDGLTALELEAKSIEHEQMGKSRNKGGASGKSLNTRSQQI